MERLSIYFTRAHSSIEVQDTDATRNTSAKSIVSAIHNMQDEDRELLKRFCAAVLECTNGNCRRLEEW